LSVYETTDGAGDEKVGREGAGVTYGIGGGGEVELLGESTGGGGEVELLGESTSVGGKGKRQLQNLLVVKKLFKYVKWHKRFLKQVKSA